MDQIGKTRFFVMLHETIPNHTAQWRYGEQIRKDNIEEERSSNGNHPTISPTVGTINPNSEKSRQLPNFDAANVASEIIPSRVADSGPHQPFYIMRGTLTKVLTF